MSSPELWKKPFRIIKNVIEAAFPERVLKKYLKIHPNIFSEDFQKVLITFTLSALENTFKTS